MAAAPQNSEWTPIFTWLSLLGAIVGIILFFTTYRFYCLPMSILSIGSGIAAIRIIRRDHMNGMSLAVIGLITGICLLIFFIVGMVVIYQTANQVPAFIEQLKNR